jgi:6-phosphofructokinase 2
MKNIATLTMNPTIDVAYKVHSMVHTHKMRTLDEHHHPGGGGINVARVFVRLGGNARCFYLSGGATGVALDGLVDLHQLVRRNITISGHTRVAVATFEEQTGREFRLVPPGPQVTMAECEQCLDALSSVSCDMLVASGSLPPGVPADFYAQVAELMQRRSIAFILDTSGDALRSTLTASGVFLVKPSLGELEGFCGRKLASIADIAEAALDIVRRDQARIVTVTLGHRGAVLARREGALVLPAVAVEARSAVGAGDSFLAAMVHALARDWDLVEAFRYGLAAGAAAVLETGSGLAHPDDIDRLFPAVAQA